MKKIMIVFLLLCIPFAGIAQQKNDLKGIVFEYSEQNDSIPVVDANVFWMGTTLGTSTDKNGTFSLPFSATSKTLIVRSVGYRGDTLTPASNEYLHILLTPEVKQVGEIEVVGERSPSFFEYKAAGLVQTMTEHELFKAACCNLSESFETNPSIDVSYTDAITGLKQIEMLGLAGIYSQITVENMPAVRGLSSAVGLTFLPGIWINSIQVSKGVGSVANGYESITGQINVELRKPESEPDRLFLNVFGNQDRRFEANMNVRNSLSSTLSSMTMAHGSVGRSKFDENGDRFLDVPLSRTINILQRFYLSYPDRFENQIGVQFVDDRKNGGTLNGYDAGPDYGSIHPKEYAFEINSQQTRLFGKTGYVFPQSSYSSVGFQWSLNRYRQNSYFNFRTYIADEHTGYFNLLFQSSFDSTIHQYRTGISFVVDEYDEKFDSTVFKRTERVPGVFAEYTFNPSDKFSMIAGIRADHHNMFGTFVTPRLHVRYTPQEDWVFRVVGGRGSRTSNALSENLAFLASSRNIDFPTATTAYKFRQESAWNVGFNVTHYFLFDWREGTIGLDVYRTMFNNQVVADLDTDPHRVSFGNLNGQSYSNSAQVEVNFQPLERLDTRIAYRFIDARQTINGTLRERPFVSRHRMLVNLSYSTEREDSNDAQMLYDLTVQWYGRKRLPGMQTNPAQFRPGEYSPDFALANAQITRSFFRGFDVYIGAENIFNFTQHHPIIDAANPDSQYFDTSVIWGPVLGRMIYAGLRWRL